MNNICSTLQSSTNTGLAATAQIFLVPSVVHLFLRVTLVAGAWAGQHARSLLYMYNIYIYKYSIQDMYYIRLWFQHVSASFNMFHPVQKIAVNWDHHPIGFPFMGWNKSIEICLHMSHTPNMFDADLGIGHK